LSGNPDKTIGITEKSEFWQTASFFVGLYFPFRYVVIMSNSARHIFAPWNPAHHIKTIYVEESCLAMPYTQEILARAGGTEIAVIKDKSQLKFAEKYPASLGPGKKTLLLCRNRGHFFKPCPGTREYRCCDYQVLNIGMNCPMDCVYCILQAYLNNPYLTFFVNIADLLAELDLALEQTTQFWRIGTGEFTDSMALDKLTGLSRILVEYMGNKKRGLLELKTKSAAVDQLEGLEHGGHTVLAWSLNSPPIMAAEEFRTASLEQRLQAAALCASWGYKLAFHFDPLIYHPGWQQGYAETITRLFDIVPADKIVWISMGALRFLPALRGIALSRFPHSRFFHEEFIMGLDGKFRYFRGLRVEMYKFILEKLRRRAAERTCIYLCMESDEIWRESGFGGGESSDLPEALDRAGQNI
jgi:spore photoproduct lyase